MRVIKKFLKRIGAYKYFIDGAFQALRIVRLNRKTIQIQGISFDVDFSCIISERVFNTPGSPNDEIKGFIRFSKNRNTLLDIGAYHGIFSFIFTSQNKNSRAFAFEPSPKAFKILKVNHSFNQDRSVHLNQLALGDDHSTIKMNYEDNHLVASNHGKIVSQTTVDLFVSENSLQVDTLKIDVEGYEYHVLNGSRALLANHGPIIFLEIHPNRLKDLGIPVEWIFDLLSELNYKIFNHDGERLPHQSLLMNDCRVICSKEILSVKS